MEGDMGITRRRFSVPCRDGLRQEFPLGRSRFFYQFTTLQQFKYLRGNEGRALKRDTAIIFHHSDS